MVIKAESHKTKKKKHEELCHQASQAKRHVHASVRACCMHVFVHKMLGLHCIVCTRVEILNTELSVQLSLCVLASTQTIMHFLTQVSKSVSTL